jgi:hypothetical protein
LKIIPDAGHSIAVEQPEIYINTIRNFLNQWRLKYLQKFVIQFTE